MRTRILVLAAIGLALGAAAGAAKGPALGIAVDRAGVMSPAGDVRYVVTGTRGGTLVRAIRVRDHKLLRSRVIRGPYGVAVVTFDGTRGGVSFDGSTLVLPSRDRGETTRFAVLSTKTLAPTNVISLDGTFGYDALSADGETLYVIEYLSETNYRVRAVSVATGGLYQRVVVDKREAGESMTGYPVTRVESGDGEWTYTLYGRDDEPAFVHGLYTEDRVAICIDLPWTVDRSTLMHVRMAATNDGELVLRDRSGTFAVVDTKNGFRVKAVRAPG